MAAIVKEVSHLAVNTNDYVVFKADILSKVNWKFSDWMINQQVDSNIHFLIKNFKFWFRNLTEAQFKRYIVLTSYSPYTKAKLTMLQVSQAFKKQFGMGILTGASESLNKNYIVLQVGTEELKQKVLSNFCTVGHHFIITSEWLKPVEQIDFAVNWLPPDILLEDVHEELSKHALVSSIKKLNLDLGDGDLLPIGKFTGSLNIASLPILESLPHILTISGFQAHWIIYQRQPLCLACRQVGHMAVACPTPYCTTCKSLSPRNHQCKIGGVKASYAAITSVPEISQVAAVESTLLVVDESLLFTAVEHIPLVDSAVTLENDLVVDSQSKDNLVDDNQDSTFMDSQSLGVKRTFQSMEKSLVDSASPVQLVTYSKKNPVFVNPDSLKLNSLNEAVFK